MANSCKPPMEDGRGPGSSSIQLATAISGLFDAAVNWKNIERDLALLIQLFYNVTVRLVSRRSGVRRQFIAEFEQTLLALPEGGRIAGLLQDLDREWGSPLESAGLRLEEIAAFRQGGR